MIIGETLQTSGTPYLSDWFPRQGDSLLAATEVLLVANGGVLFVGVQTKDQEDPDSAASVLSSTSYTTEGTYTLGAAACKELVRYVFIVSDGAGTDGYVHFRMLPAIWFYN